MIQLLPIFFFLGFFWLFIQSTTRFIFVVSNIWNRFPNWFPWSQVSGSHSHLLDWWFDCVSLVYSELTHLNFVVCFFISSMPNRTFPSHDTKNVVHLVLVNAIWRHPGVIPSGDYDNEKVIFQLNSCFQGSTARLYFPLSDYWHFNLI